MSEFPSRLCPFRHMRMFHLSFGSLSGFRCSRRSFNGFERFGKGEPLVFGVTFVFAGFDEIPSGGLTRMGSVMFSAMGKTMGRKKLALSPFDKVLAHVHYTRSGNHHTGIVPRHPTTVQSKYAG